MMKFTDRDPTERPETYTADNVTYTKYILDVLPFILLYLKKLETSQMTLNDKVLTARWLIDLIFYIILNRDEDLLEITFTSVYDIYAKNNFEQYNSSDVKQVIEIVANDLKYLKEEITLMLEKLITMEDLELYGLEFIPAEWNIHPELSYAKLSILV